MPQTLAPPDWDKLKPLTQADWDQMKPVGTAPVVTTPPKSQAGFLESIMEKSGLSHPIDALWSLLKDPYQVPEAAHNEAIRVKETISKAYDAYKKGDTSTAIKEGTRAIPVLGPGIEDAADQLRAGNYTGAAGSATGVASPFLVGPLARTAKIGGNLVADTETAQALKARWDTVQAAKAAAKVTKANEQGVADFMKAMPPTKGANYTRQDVLRQQPYIVAEHGAAPIESITHTREAFQSIITQIEENVGELVQQYPDAVIKTNPMEAAKRVLRSGERTSDISIGMKELEDLGLDKPLKFAEAEAKRLRLNTENTRIMNRDNISRAAARRADPAFAARDAAAEALRDGVYDGLEDLGVKGVRKLRQDEGSAIALRDAAQHHELASEATVSGTGNTKVKARIGAGIVQLGSTAAGAGAGSLLGGGPGAAIGGTIGAVLGGEGAKLVARPALTRNALITRAFKNLTADAPVYPNAPMTRRAAGLLGPKPIESVVPDTSFVQGVPASEDVFATRPKDRLLPETSSFTRLPQDMPHITDASFVREGLPPGITMRGLIKRDPKTGRFRRIFMLEEE